MRCKWEASELRPRPSVETTACGRLAVNENIFMSIVNLMISAEVFLPDSKGKWGMNPILPEETGTKRSEMRVL